MIITISGLAGTGTSSTAKELADRLGYEFQSSGNMFRSFAAELGMNIYDFDDLCKTDSKYDIELDRRVREYADNNPNSVIDSRLAWYFVPESFKVKLECDEEVRMNRIAKRENISVEKAKEETHRRERAIYDRYKRYYNIENFDQNSNFDLVVNTTSTDLPEVVGTIERETKKRMAKN